MIQNHESHPVVAVEVGDVQGVAAGQDGRAGALFRVDGHSRIGREVDHA